MARPSNAQSDLSGARLPFFSENLLPGSPGVNVFAQSPDFIDVLIPHVEAYDCRTLS